MRVYLQRLPDGDGEPRFCHLQLQPDLMEGWQLVRETGRQGRAGRVSRTHYASLEAAQEALERARNDYLKRGFRIVFAEGETPAGRD